MSRTNCESCKPATQIGTRCCRSSATRQSENSCRSRNVSGTSPSSRKTFLSKPYARQPAPLCIAHRAPIGTLTTSALAYPKESQGPGKEPDSIQARVIRELKQRDFGVIVDDDGKGEAADVVAISLIGDRTTPSRIDVEFFRCKYSQADTAGHRIKDLYEVCGQAQKSISWMMSPDKRSDLFTHLLRRE